MDSKYYSERTMKNIVFCSFILSLIFFGQYSAAQGLEKQISGAVIVVALTGDAVLSDQEGKILKERMSVGSIIPVGRFAETKKGSSHLYCFQTAQL